MFNMSPSQMKKLAQQMGMKEMRGIKEVIFRTENGDMVIKNPQVTSMNMMGQKTFQVIGELEEIESSQEVAEVNEDDVKMIAQQTGASEEDAKKALQETGGDIAQAILSLQGSS